ncbi:MAG: PH domain-containing protein [Planctomycetota bacterium]
MTNQSEAEPPESSVSFRAEEITRPAPVLLRYYLLGSLLAGPFFPIAFIPLLCKYVTLRYRFDDSGIAMQWGVLFRREIYLTYRRIQDIHLTRNIVQRWMGLATLAVQTASGSATPEMSIEGILEAKELRDHLYGKMRGARGDSVSNDDSTDEDDDRALELLTDIRDNLRQLVEAGADNE